MSIDQRATASAVAAGGSPVASTAFQAFEEQLIPSSALRFVFTPPLVDALPPNEFLKDLQREKRRAERSRTSLSIVLYRLDDGPAKSAKNASALLEVLHRSKRETDIVGHVGDDTIAVLCPDTDERGAHCFMHKIAASVSEQTFHAITATYPDDLFETLGKGATAARAFQPLLVAETTPQPYPLKRALDIVGALMALSLLWPVMLLAALAVAVTSRGPIVFKQTRLGQGGQPFTFYKFRSMVTNGDDRIHREFVASLIKGVSETGDTVPPGPATYKIKSDPRVTPVGRFIRRTSIDELPQLFNVLKGDMSLVGPRPPIPYEATQYQPWHLRRILAIKPGITGLWQVDGRSRVSFNDMVRMDLRYIHDCSLGLDIRILLKTVMVVFRCEGAV